LTSKIKKIKEIKVFIENLNQDQKISLIKELKKKRDEKLREITKKSISRWDDF